MDYKQQITALADRIARLKGQVNSEEATKTSFILPFLQALGYDVFNPLEVTHECICDYGTKKGEKIDYTISIDGTPIMIVECKHWEENLEKHQAQLFRYYQVSQAKFGLLTNGIVYKFFSDLEKPNMMDNKPFFEINMLELRDSHIEKLKEFGRDQYNVNTILNFATELKYVNALRNLLSSLATQPTDEYTRFLAKQVYDGMVTQKVLEDFKPMISRAHQQIIADNVNVRLKSAFAPEVSAVDVPVKESREEGVNLFDDFIYLKVKDVLDFSRKERVMKKWFAKMQQEVFGQICEEIYPLFEPYNIEYPVIKIRTMKSRWGSCQPTKGIITLNAKMIAAPREAIEYVVLHEFAHFIHPNHSKDFYSFVERMMPDWKQRRAMLNGIE